LGDKGTLGGRIQPLNEVFTSRIEALSGAQRSLLTLLFAVAGVALLVAGRLAVVTDGWVAWLITLALLEPVGVLAILAAGVVADPTSRLSLYLNRALARRQYGSAVLVVVSLGAILEGVRWCVRELIRR
jgi:hypothetical protein